MYRSGIFQQIVGLILNDMWRDIGIVFNIMTCMAQDVEAYDELYGNIER
jgi:hypothetical protein